MSEKIICDSCGEPIDQSEPYYTITAQKLQVENVNDPTQINVPTTIEIPQQFDYHDGHQPEIQGMMMDTPPEDDKEKPKP
jgi:hypothetical protein